MFWVVFKCDRDVFSISRVCEADAQRQKQECSDEMRFPLRKKTARFVLQGAVECGKVAEIDYTSFPRKYMPRIQTSLHVVNFPTQKAVASVLEMYQRSGLCVGAFLSEQRQGNTWAICRACSAHPTSVRVSSAMVLSCALFHAAHECEGRPGICIHHSNFPVLPVHRQRRRSPHASDGFLPASTLYPPVVDDAPRAFFCNPIASELFSESAEDSEDATSEVVLPCRGLFGTRFPWSVAVPSSPSSLR